MPVNGDLKLSYVIIGKRDGHRIVWIDEPEHTSYPLDGDVVLFDDCLGRAVYEVKGGYNGFSAQFWQVPDEYQAHIDILLADTGRI